MSFETGGTFDPWQKGPHTKWGQHRGLIQMGEPQRAKYGYTEGAPLSEKLSAVGRYLDDAGVRPGMGLLDVYSAINAGRVGRYSAVDGATNVRQKVDGMSDHRRRAEAFLRGTSSAVADTSGTGSPGGSFLTNTDQLGAEYDPYTNQQQRFMDRREEETAPPPGTNFEDGYDEFGQIVSQTQNWPAIADFMQPYRPDPNWQLTEDMLKKLQGRVPDDFIPTLAGATSQGQFDHLVSRALERTSFEQKMAGAGWGGTAATLVAGFLDPVAIAAAVGSEGVAGPALAAVKFGRMGRLLSGAASGAIGNVAAAGAVTAIDPFHDEDLGDLAFAAGIGAMWGGAIGGIRRRPHLQEEADALTRAGQHTLTDLENGQTPIDTIRPGPASGGAGGVATVKPLAADELDIYDSDVAHSFWNKARYSVAAKLGGSRNAFTRAIYDHFGLDAAGKSDGSVTAIPATVRMARRYKSLLDREASVYFPARKAWKKDMAPKLGRRASNTMFNEEIATFIRTEESKNFSTVHPSVKTVGTFWRQQAKELGLDLQNPAREAGGIARPINGFANFVENLYYLPRLMNHRALNKLTREFGDEGLERLIANAMMDTHRDMDPLLAQRVSRGYLRRLRNVGAGVEELDGHTMGGSVDDLRNIINELDLSPEDKNLVESSMYRMEKQEGSGTGEARGKRRTFLNEGYKAQMTAIDGSSREVRLDELFINDYRILSNHYFKRAAGWTALGRIRVENPSQPGKWLIDGITSDADFEKLIRNVRKTGTDKGLSKEEINKDVENLQFLYDHLRGNYQRWGGKKMQALYNHIRDYNFIRVMGQAGFPSMAEIANGFTQIGVKAMLSQMPSVRNLVRRIRGPSKRQLQAWHEARAEALAAAQAANAKAEPIEAFNSGREVNQSYSGGNAYSSAFQTGKYGDYDPYWFDDFENVRGSEGVIGHGHAGGKAMLPDWYNRVEATLNSLADQFGVKRVKLFVGKNTSNANGKYIQGNAWMAPTGVMTLHDGWHGNQAMTVALHEFGHHLDNELLKTAPFEVRAAIQEAWLKQSHQHKGKQTGQEMYPLSHNKGENLDNPYPANTGQGLDDQREYVWKYNEWFAEQAARFIEDGHAPTNATEVFFKKVADLWKKLLAAITGKVPLADEVKDLLMGHWKGDVKLPDDGMLPEDAIAHRAEAARKEAEAEHYRQQIEEPERLLFGSRLASELNAAFGLRGNSILGSIHERMDTFGDMGSEPSNGMVAQGFQKAKDLTANISLLRPVTFITQEWVARAAAQNFADMAMGRAKGPHVSRLRQLGFKDDAELNSVLDQLRTHAKWTRNDTGKLIELNLNKWDANARSQFLDALYVWTHKAIQENDPGMMNAFLSKPMMRLILQFRSFMLGSWDAQFMSNSYALMQGDRARALAYFSASLVAATMAHTLRVGLVGLGMPTEKRRDYYEKMLNPKALAAAGFSRAGWTSFIPGTVDTGLEVLGMDPLFSYRSSGLSQSVFGSPSQDLVDNAGTTAASISEAVRGENPITKREGAAAFSLLPWQNFIPMAWLQAHMVKDLPDYEPRK